ncbi:MAG TPA: hypothetical protein DCS82_02590 [Rhodospirillaceae bacterium]|nr:hypothetical protein [Rhodospirillaceae bacterium]HAA93858.1 hypothetical protein [Rhodospirillaceae bacterium]HAT34577.1 hypothetical protein [Rhodospirillaceae bacterium]|tara:strand:- start:61 stop:471 length:411 start_codon:yes stop_codon:yes gene_type:complete
MIRRVTTLFLLAALSGFFLVGCAAFNTDAVVDETNRQTSAGITDFRFETELGPDGKPYVSGVRLIDGKEKSRVKAKVELPSGLKASYEAEDVRSFPGQQIQGIVQKAFVDAGIEQTKLIKEMIPKMVEALKPLWAK